jgi:hypothetical protein
MDDSALIRQLIGLRARDRVPEDEAARMSTVQLRARPEATIAAIVRGWFEFRSNGYADADIFREIEGRRAKEYGEEPLPGDLNLDTYTRYRMRLEHRDEAALHDPVYVMQAVHLAAETIGKEYGPRGEAPGLRSIPPGRIAILVYAALLAIGQGIAGAARLHKLGFDSGAWLTSSLFGLAMLAAVGGIGYAGRASWGRSAMSLALAAEAIGGGLAIAFTTRGDSGDKAFIAMFAIHTAVALACLAYVHRSKGDADDRPR